MEYVRVSNSLNVCHILKLRHEQQPLGLSGLNVK